MKIVASRYELEEEIGAGGEASVFRARDKMTGIDVAIRLGGPRLADLTKAMQLTHPSWVRLLDGGHDPEHGAFLIFELLRGQTLRRQLEESPFNLAASLNFASRALEAVQMLHDSGWVHGDLNADNFLEDHDAGWKLLELPFHRPRQVTKPLFGSIYTLAPEQFAGESPNLSTDIYALGCLCYFAASGQFPHHGATPQEIAVERLRFPTKPLMELVPIFPTSCGDFVMQLLARDPVDRPPNAAAARRLLESAIAR